MLEPRVRTKNRAARIRRNFQPLWRLSREAGFLGFCFGGSWRSCLQRFEQLLLFILFPPLDRGFNHSSYIKTLRGKKHECFLIAIIVWIFNPRIGARRWPSQLEEGFGL
jgi:hypothetical protein